MDKPCVQQSLALRQSVNTHGGVKICLGVIALVVAAVAKPQGEGQGEGILLSPVDKAEPLPGAIAPEEKAKAKHQREGRLGGLLAPLFKKQLEDEGGQHNHHAPLNRVAEKGGRRHAGQQGQTAAGLRLGAIVSPGQQSQQGKGQREGVGIESGRIEHKGGEACTEHKGQGHRAVGAEQPPGQQADQCHRGENGQSI